MYVHVYVVHRSDTKTVWQYDSETLRQCAHSKTVGQYDSGTV